MYLLGGDKNSSVLTFVCMFQFNQPLFTMMGIRALGLKYLLILC